MKLQRQFRRIQHHFIWRVWCEIILPTLSSPPPPPHTHTHTHKSSPQLIESNLTVKRHVRKPCTQLIHHKSNRLLYRTSLALPSRHFLLPVYSPGGCVNCKCLCKPSKNSSLTLVRLVTTKQQARQTAWTAGAAEYIPAGVRN